MPQPLRSTPRPAPQLDPTKLRKATTRTTRHVTAAAALALLLLSAAPALAAPGHSEEFAETTHSAFAALWERVAAVPGVLVGLWEEIGTAIDPWGTPAPAPQATGTGTEPAGI